MITILGATATGKTGLAASLAARLDGEVISADSRQVYKQMDIGTGKDYNDYVVNDQRIPYHLIDIVEPGTEYNVYEYQQDFIHVYNDICKRGKQAFLCGGTGMYLEAILNGYTLAQVPINKKLRTELEEKSDEELTTILSALRPLHNTTDTIHRKRTIRSIEIATHNQDHPDTKHSFPDINTEIFGLWLDREANRQRITIRLKERLKNGMIEEVKGLLDKGIHPDKLKFYGLEYKFLTMYILGELNYDDMFQQLNLAIHQFAKRQRTWFRKMERNGFKINWIDGDLSINKKLEKITRILNGTMSRKAAVNTVKI